MTLTNFEGLHLETGDLILINSSRVCFYLAVGKHQNLSRYLLIPTYWPCESVHDIKNTSVMSLSDIKDIKLLIKAKEIHKKESFTECTSNNLLTRVLDIAQAIGYFEGDKYSDSDNLYDHNYYEIIKELKRRLEKV